MCACTYTYVCMYICTLCSRAWRRWPVCACGAGNSFVELQIHATAPSKCMYVRSPLILIGSNSYVGYVILFDVGEPLARG